MGSSVRCLLIVLCLGAAGAQADGLSEAQRLAQRFAPGSITSKEQAERALSEAAVVHQQLQLEFEAQRLHCEDVFFVNHCLGGARRRQRDGEHEVTRVTLEAHDLQRHLEAREHAESRAAELRRQAAEELQRPEREREALTSAQMREQNAAAREQDALQAQQNAALASTRTEQRQREQEADLARKDALRPQQEAGASREFQQKQEQAQAYAQTRARDREANAKRREERKSERDAQASPPAAPAPGPAAP